MGSARPKDAPAVVEPVYCPPVSVDGIASIHRLPENRFQFTVYQSTVSDDGHVEHVIVARLICPTSAIPIAIRQVTRAIAEPAMDFVKGPWLSMM